MTKLKEYINTLKIEFEINANPEIAIQQKAYMRNQFEFYGLKSKERRDIQKPFMLKAFLPPKADLDRYVKEFWSKPEREYHHFAQEFAFRYIKQLEKKDIELYEFMITNHSWWDTVDFIANKLVGGYMKKFPEERDKCAARWLKSGNIWLQRTALLFQIKYKQDLDAQFMAETINALLGSNEFFINKAIGWVLREYSRTDPEWVQDFVEKTPLLHSLSRREALRLLK